MDNLQFHYKIKHDSYLKGLSLDLIMDISYSSNFCLFDFLLNKNKNISKLSKYRILYQLIFEIKNYLT